ncbi:MAG TPA: NAD(P)H-dependent oxidoreductase [Ilumatobacteraceae bacterium]|nr:NAD(P)H-dependent oxidoreductase [Ilumatobacteraceae bacterium]
MSRRRCYVVYCHPLDDSFAHAALERVLAGLARRPDVDVRLSDLYADDFSPEFSLEERRTHKDSPDGKTEIAEYADNLRWCDSLIVVHPTWFSGPPAMLKGWLDRVLVQGVAWTLPDGASRLKPLLRNIRAITVVTTHGSSKLINSLQGEAGKRIWFRSVRVLCHPLTRCRWVAFYGIDRASDAKRRAFLGRVERAMQRV